MILKIFLWKNGTNMEALKFFFNMLIFFQLKILVWRKWILKVIITRKIFYNNVWWWMLIRFIVVIISQYTNMKSLCWNRETNISIISK